MSKNVVLPFDSAEQLALKYYATQERKTVRWKGNIVSLETKDGTKTEMTYYQIKNLLLELWKKEGTEGDKAGLTSKIVYNFTKDLKTDTLEAERAFLHAKTTTLLKRIRYFLCKFFTQNSLKEGKAYRTVKTESKKRSDQWIGKFWDRESTEWTTFLGKASPQQLLYSLPSGNKWSAYKILLNPQRYAHLPQAKWYIRVADQVATKAQSRGNIPFFPELARQLHKKNLLLPMKNFITLDFRERLRANDGILSLPEKSQQETVIHTFLPLVFAMAEESSFVLKKKLNKFSKNQTEEGKKRINEYIEKYADPQTRISFLETYAKEPEMQLAQMTSSKKVAFDLTKEDVDKQWGGMVDSLKKSSSILEVDLFPRKKNYENKAPPLNENQLQDIHNVVKENPRIQSVKLNGHFEKTDACNKIVAEIGKFTQRRTDSSREPLW